MNKILILTQTFLLIHLNLMQSTVFNAQDIEKPTNYIIDSFYMRFKIFIDSDTSRCIMQSAIIGLHNSYKIGLQYADFPNHMRQDSIYLYYKIAYDSFPHECFYIFFDSDKDLANHTNKNYSINYPKSFKYMTKINDSIKLTYNKPIQEKLIKILAEDQRDRNNFDKLLSNKTTDERKLKKFASLLDQNDLKRLNQIDSIIKIHGYPGKTLVSSKLSHIAITIIQHSQTEYQLKYLDLIIDAVNKGELYKAEFSYFIDKLLISTGRKQIFGNQYSIKNGEVYFFPIGHPETVDQRRRKCNLFSMDKYKESIYKEVRNTKSN